MSDEIDIEITEAPAAAAEITPDPTPDAEDRALAMGWTPKGQFKGDPERWVDAETFIKRGEEFLPFLKANNKRLEQAHDRSVKEIAGLKQTLAQFADHHSKTEARMYARAMADLQVRLDAAAEVGDVQAVRDATAEIVDLQKDARTPPLVERQTEPVSPQFERWVEANPWFERDQVMKAAAVAIGDLVAAQNLPPTEFFQEVDKRMRAEFPHKFTNPRRTEPGAVESATANRRSNAKTYSDLPADAKSACDDFVKKGVLTREQYCKEFFS